jgi:hypothetical protein
LSRWFCRIPGVVERTGVVAGVGPQVAGPIHRAPDGRAGEAPRPGAVRIWRAIGLKPHTVETWKLSTDPEFIGKVRDVVGLYMTRPSTPWSCAWTRSPQIQTLDRTAPIPPMRPATPARMTHDYVRNGSTSLFAAYDLASGYPYRRHRHQAWNSTWLWTTTTPKRPRQSRTGCSSTRGYTCTSPRPAHRG